MKNKKFTLTELIIAVIVISLLASIVMVKILDMKNKSIGVAVANNTKIIQTAVDRYSIDNNGEYPIKNDVTISLSNPQLIDVAKLKRDGYLKKELDTSKVKVQYYWLDVFGVAWGSTEKTVDNLISIQGMDKNHLEFNSPAGATAYRIYEVIGYNKEGEINNKKDRHYKFVSETKLNKKRQKINFPIPDSTKTYLISAVDKYDQETAPVGIFYKGQSSFKPILSGDGKYEFEIESYDEMFWIDFKKVDDTPGLSTITYRFKVKDEQGVYGNWTENYSSLASSKGIKIEVDMKSDAAGNKPSLYDLNVIYRYAYEEKLSPPAVELGDLKNPSKVCPTGYKTSNVYPSNGEPPIWTYVFKLPDNQHIDNIKNPNIYGYSIIHIEYMYADANGVYVPASDTSEIPSGSCVNIVYELEKDKMVKGPEKPSNPGSGYQPLIDVIPLTPDVILCEKDCISICKDCAPVCLENCESHCEKNCNTPEEYCKETECMNPPVCQEGDVGCTPPVCTDNCSAGPPTSPNPKDAALTDPDWITKDTLRFFANGPKGTPTRWLDMIAKDNQDQINTRIIYRFAKSNGYYWSGEIDDIKKVGQSQSIMIVAYLQVYKNVPNYQIPEVESIQLIHEKGTFNLNANRPTLTILPKKDNNEGRDVFSDASVFDWQYTAFDPRGRKITTIAWDNKQNTYPVGIHTIKAIVTNETNLSSEWAEYTFEVVSEQPVAKISKNINPILIDKKIEWAATKSYDPDGDTIIATEWRGDKKSVYDKEGTYTVGLRVQDSEGYWSNWAEETFVIQKDGVKTYRIEAEDPDKTRVLKSYSDMTTISSSNYSGGQATSIKPAQHLQFKFTGTGFDLKQINALNVTMSIDGKSLISSSNSYSAEGESIYSIRGLENKTHSLAVITNTRGSNIIDYLDVYNTVDTPTISNLFGQPVDKNDVELNHHSNKIVTHLQQKLKVSYTLFKDSFVSISVLGLNGKEIKNIQNELFLEGGTVNTHSTIWDGKDNNGKTVASGEYNLKVKAVGVAREGFTEEYFPIVVDNETPVFRIEAEDTDKTRVIKSTSAIQTISDSKYSGGQGLSNVPGQYLQFKFTGTGFDLKQIDALNVLMTLDSKALMYSSNSYSAEGESIYSIRGLENKAHSLVVRTDIRGSNIIDYLDVYNEDDTPVISTVKSNPVINNGVDLNYSSNLVIPHLHQKIRTFYTLAKDSFVTINVLDAKGNKIKTLQQDIYSKGGTINTHSVIWDGEDHIGNTMENGIYTLEIRAVGVRNVGLTVSEYQIIINNTKPTYRIEAEDTDKTRVTKSTSAIQTMSDSKYSGGQGLSNVPGQHLQFKFTGTGFDLKQIDALNVLMTLDSKALMYSSNSYSAEGESIYSIRGLENKAHTLSVKTDTRGSNIIDYLDVYK